MTKKAEKKEHKKTSSGFEPKGILIAIGGAENKGQDPEPGSVGERNGDFFKLEILERFCKELSGKNPLIAVIPTASSVPEDSANDYKEAFGQLGYNNVQVVDVRDRNDLDNPEYLEIIRNADGVLFTGGDQLKLTAIFGGSELLYLLKQRYIQDHIVIAGTSAGAAAMSTGMIYEGQQNMGMLKGDVRATTGLEFFKNVAIDTHFISRGRMIRMAHRLATNPGCLGIGLEEDTAIIVKNGRDAEVIGSGLIVIMDARGCTSTNIHQIQNGEPVTLRNMKVDLLGKGDTFSIPDFNPMHSY